MDDIEPNNFKSPDIIHVVSYCEAVRLADPAIINESIQITTNALNKYRIEKKKGLIDNMINNLEVDARTEKLVNQVDEIRKILELNIKNLYSPQGLYLVFKKGVLVAPYLWERRDEFKEACSVKTNFIDGGVHIIDEKGMIIDPVERVKKIFG
jgi:hypothetical protein